MEQLGAQGEMSGSSAQERILRDEVICPNCGSDRVYRLFREGFLQEHVFPLFGYYPWQCKTCARDLLIRKRKKAKRALPAT